MLRLCSRSLRLLKLLLRLLGLLLRLLQGGGASLHLLFELFELLLLRRQSIAKTLDILSRYGRGSGACFLWLRVSRSLRHQRCRQERNYAPPPEKRLHHFSFCPQVFAEAILVDCHIRWSGRIR